jgi:hypothetical protein
MERSFVGAESGTRERRLQYQLYKGPLFTHLTLSARKTKRDPLKGCLNVLASTEYNEKKKILTNG